MSKGEIGVAMCGSFCTFRRIVYEIKRLTESGYNVTVIMSENAYNTDTRFGKAKDFIDEIEGITGREIIHTIGGAEPIGPKKMFDIIVVMPCTGNTLSKMANGITDTAVTMACKSHRRNNRPILIGVSSNDALSGSADNIGKLLSQKNIYFIPMGQDDVVNKESSLVADFSLCVRGIEYAIQGKQVQPLLF